MNFQKAVLVDMDGTLVPGTETRNRATLQSMVNEFTESVGRGFFQIPWDYCNGKDEKDIHRILVEQGLEGLDGRISAEDFQARAKIAYTEVENVDYSPRPGMISLLQFIKNYGVTPVLVTNSLRDCAMDVLGRSFEIHSRSCGIHTNPEEVFPVIITKSDVLEARMNPKPSADPFILAETRLKSAQHYGYYSSYTSGFSYHGSFALNYRREDFLILEDSGTGTAAGFAFTGRREQVIQFVDMAKPCENAGHHVMNMVECAEAMYNFWGVQETKGNTPIKDHMLRIAYHNPRPVAELIR